ncbi:AMP-binding protein (plasmid) [Streptomyces sp. HUAS 31]|uniref:class I adenylate-forming enzyme family protein n=1 Tax=Streptomyces sp. HUAS 31 TaxID=3020055 RepID=UPI0023059DF9|nr:AMP-binding protein [Streptomyces sp. HUAS 31]WCE02541.1 AMP-binding protein [Streptomyces sp. HUAS 31]
MPTSLDYPDLAAGELLTAAARLYGDRLAVVDGAEQLTFAELHQQAVAFAHGVRGAGVRDGDVVLLHQPNSLWFLVTYYGALLAGATVVPANPLQPAPGLRSQLLDTGAVLAVSHPAHLATLLDAREGTGVRTVVVVPPTATAPCAKLPPAHDGVVPLADFAADGAGAPPRTAVAGDDTAHIIYTGGTTGVPKGVRVLHRNVIANVAQMTAWRAAHLITAGESGEIRLRPLSGPHDQRVHPGAAVTLMVSPLFHVHALVNMSFLLLCGTTVVLTGRFSPENLLAAVEHHRATYLLGSPTMWHALVDSPDVHTRDLSSVRVISSGGAPADKATLLALQAVFPQALVVEGYGLTEGTCVVTSAPLRSDAPRKLGSVGLPLCDTTLEIRSTTGDGALCGPHEVGELWVRGPQVTAGYLNQPEASAEQFVEGWLRTGDLGYTDEEGFVFLSGRAKEMLIYKGYNVYPRELEDILRSHRGVRAAAVVGSPDARVGQKPTAFVVARTGAVIDPDELMAYVAERVVPYKRIRAVHVVDSLPLSAAGKVLKSALRVPSTTGQEG